jgi:hypothetical protein
MRKYLASALFFFVVLAVIGLGVRAGVSAEKSAPDVQIQIQGGEKGSPGQEGAPGAPGAPGPQGAPGAPAPQAPPASPSSSGGTTILGMDSTVALLIGAVLILVVIVAIVAISKSGSKA